MSDGDTAPEPDSEKYIEEEEIVEEERAEEESDNLMKKK
jgi:hypothetical protein